MMNEYILCVDLPERTGQPSLYVQHCDPNDVPNTTEFTFNSHEARRFFTVATANAICNKINGSDDFTVWKNVHNIKTNFYVKPVPAYYNLGSHIKI